MEDRREKRRDEFIDLVLSWSLEEILDENLYKNQVEKIPQSFESVDQYLGSYIFPLLEETRSELASAMEKMYKAPFAEVTSLTELRHGKFLHSVEVDFWRNRIIDRGREPYRTLPGDIVLLSDLKPESDSDLGRVGWKFILASVIDLLEDENGDNCPSTGFKVKAAMSIDVEETQSKSFYVVFLTNMATNRRIWNALHMRKNLRIFKKVLCNTELDEENCESCPLEFHRQMKVKFESTISSGLNESQNSAILASLVRTRCNHKTYVELIWGPPGTGKTRTVSVLLYNLFKMNVRTLICAPTNVAITELATRVISLLRDSFQDEHEMFLSFPLGDILIFGNKDRLKVGSNIEEIFLDYRVNKLTECLVPLTGLKHWISSMIDFLEDFVSQYLIYVANEQSKVKENHEVEIQQSESKTFLEYARDRFRHIASPLRESLSTFITHLPRIVGQNFQKTAVQLISLLNSIETLLYEDNLTSDELEIILESQEMICSLPSFVYMRNECVSTLRSLWSSLAKLDLPPVTSKTKISDFCLQKASLIFCTSSSSYKLHMVDMEPINVMVIDEAAQVKESESAIALQIPDVRHAILVGDELQLPPTVNSKLSEEAGFGKSLFARLSSLGHSKHLLNTQYRMHPSISQFPNSNFYDNQILDAPSVQDESYQRCYLQGKMFGPYSFINILGGKEEVDDVGHSRRNMVEVAVVLKIVQKIFKAWNGSKEKLSIGVISPYAAQVAAIHDKIKQNYENLQRFAVKVKSVDGFQGGEEDIVIISTVRSNRHGSIGFLSNPQRINVALTRARHCLWILGNEGTLSKVDSVWETLIRDAKRRQCFFTANDDYDIGKAIFTVQKEQEELEDLLNGESIIFKYARWKVTFSDNFRKSFGKLRSSRIKKLVMNILLKLASGWRPKKIDVDLKCQSSLYIVKQFKVEGYYVLCSIDIMKDLMWTQFLKVWDVLPLVEIPKLLKRLDSIFSMLTDDFINRCKEKCIEGNLEVPKIWSSSDVIVRFKILDDTKSSTNSATDRRNYVENSRVSESLLLMKFYSLSSGSVNHLLSDQEGREVELPFEVTEEEREIIIFPRSSFILGRSGTGKTTVLTMKLFQKLQLYYIASGESIATPNKTSAREDVVDVQLQGHSTLRQLFVTVSPKLCHAVKRHVSQLKSFATQDFISSSSFTETDDIEDMAEFKDIPDTFVGIQPEKYPLIITFHKFLMMLDGTLGNSYFERFHDVRDSSQYYGRSFRSVALETFMRRNEVTYDRFSSFYWPHFNTKLTKNLDSSQVFTEIMSHIKGGLLAGEACDVKRNRQDYVSLSESRVSTLSGDKREVIYDIYQDYEKMKMERGEFDVADFVIDIHLRLSKENLAGDKMDFVYVDEVQDLYMRQIVLFRHICKNIDDGYVFSGDTAQTIARGIDFRFEDIRSLFYNEFVMKAESTSTGRGGKGLISDTFRMCRNFRTHTGVLRLAQSVIDLLCHFFPLSVDVLAPETSFIYGESPVVLEPGSDANSIITIFGCSRSETGKWVGFGAEQVILVRDDSARKEILKYIGRQALVLTIVECKGLEFQDVLLYNFFGSSPLSNQWRVLYEFLKQKDLFDPMFPKSFPSFSLSKHSILCSELKQLYVAITRTRQRLWICENNAELSKPMLDYWQRLGLVQVRKLDDSLAEGMQRASSPEEWKSQGMQLFWEKNYEMATMCFERAGEATWEKRAKASGLRASADYVRISNAREAQIMIREAAELFHSIGRAASAAECFFELEEYKRAGMIYLHECGTSELRKAGECFTLAGCYNTAANVYAKGSFFLECLSACTKGKLFDMGLQYIEFWKQQAPSNTEIMTKLKEIDQIEQGFLKSGALEYYRKKNNALFMKFVRAFGTMESKRNFLRSKDCLEELLSLEIESGNFKEAANIAKLMGDILNEVNLLVEAGDFGEASMLILSYIISNSIWVSTFQGWPLKSFPRKEELLSKLMSSAKKVSGTFHASICAEARVLSHESMKLAELMHSYFASKQFESRTFEILSVRKLLDVHFQIHPTKYELDHELPFDLKGYSEAKILRNQVSVRTLVYIWKLFKENSLEIIECLRYLERGDTQKFEGTIEFCLHYFGVRLSQDSSVACLLMNPDAKWVENVPKSFMLQEGKLVTLHAHHFVSAAQTYWRQELVSVGLTVLEALRLLFGVKHSSIYCRCICLTFIFDITKFLIESKSLVLMESEDLKLREFLRLSTKYFEIVFPLDPRQLLSANMAILRETELSKTLLEEVISRNVSTYCDLTYKQTGEVLMIWLGSGKPKHYLCEKMAKKLPKNSYWKAFIEMLMTSASSNQAPQVLSDTILGNVIKQSGSLHDSLSSSSTKSLSHRFLKALEETFNSNWRVRNYISPKCFLYLLERLLILAPHPHGYFFTSKSSFVEWVVCQQSDANPSVNFDTDMASSPKSIINFTITVIHHFLFANVMDTVEWIRRSNIDDNYYFPVLVQRLVMILCLVYLNSEMPLNMLFRQLHSDQIKSRLHREFYDAVLHGQRNKNPPVETVAAAFKAIEDPIVIVTLRENSFEFVSPDAIFLDLRLFSCKKDIFDILFPSSTVTSTARVTTVESYVTESGNGLPETGPNQGKSSVLQSSDMMPKTDSNSSSENEMLDPQTRWGFLRDMSHMLLSRRSENNVNMEPMALKKKVQEYMNFIEAALFQLTEQKSPSSVKDENMHEATDTIEELNLLSSLLDKSNLDGQDLSKMDELLKSLESRRPRLEDLLSTVLDTNSSVVSTEMRKFPTVTIVNSDASEDYAVDNIVKKPINQASEPVAQVKGKMKNNNKAKKGKRGKKK
ncbi:hypothetical protein F511_40287 [Dorcoceras hygrometricum]|uniref:UvrD-like helicase ATP-binding domain-containing protein n=1 Tax=Dorcoceras hygrometricum TaxID=472368 RepID=A0A2Z7A7J1_9LAMI|nr:hypothetical protein F511_40287 [Dorcoceras hygrometricum]